MKQLSKIFVSVFFSLILCAISTLTVFYYTHPMEDKSYNLSLMAEDGGDPVGEKGWTVYTDKQGVRKNLTPDGIGGYTGLDYAGQTFYFSRELTEELESPTLQIGVVNRSVSVFLDDTLIYTDYPELDNRIGYLELPMQEYDRADPVKFSLPRDYLGHTLTIAQSSPTFSEKQFYDETVYPCEVTLYCGYSYESELIAQTAVTMIPAVLLFALELILLLSFIWNASHGNFYPALPVLALTAFFQMCSILTKAGFFYQYAGTFPVDLVSLSFYLSIGTLLVFLTMYARPLRLLFSVLTLLHWIATIFGNLMQWKKWISYGDTYVFFVNLPQITGFVVLVAVLICAFYLSNKGNQFFSYLFHAACVISVGYGILLLISITLIPTYTSSVLSRISVEFSIRTPNFSLKLVWYLCLLSALFAAVTDLRERDADQRAETCILTTKNRLTLESYENLRQQTEEVMMLRHDMTKHYTVLRQMAEQTPEKLYHYLDELLEQPQNIRPVVASENEMLNIIINGKLHTAVEKGISTEIIRAEAPKNLPLKDTELCCLIMNILDNAIHAASDAATETPYIKLDFHCKDQHFIFSCENSMSPNLYTHKKISMRRHGYGLKIIHKIMEQWGDMVSISQDKTHYKISVVIPLS